MSFTRPAWSNMMLPGLRSRWVTFLPRRKRTARSTASTTAAASAGLKRRSGKASRYSLSVTPSTNSAT
ncbi:MAG: hypothetical protein QM765_15840 [Myxococcales bacterium]